jgi:hypothetical protein
MVIQLTPEEQQNLLWEQGDEVEVLSGTINFTSSNQYKRVQTEHALTFTQKKFFFQASDPTWGTHEWVMSMEAEIPNGPALLVVYKRGGTGEAWGIVSMVNQAWTHSLPLDSIGLSKGTTKAKHLGGAQWLGCLMTALVVVVLAVVTCGIAIPILGILMVVPGVRDAVQKITGVRKNEDELLRMGASARALMFRVSQNANYYWQGSGSTLGGRL